MSALRVKEHSRLRKVGPIVGAFVVGILVTLLVTWLMDTVAESPVEDASSGSGVKFVALGDSYISGEGAKQFFLGTDVDANRCRRAPTSYPYLMKQILDVRLVFAACSGARTFHVSKTGQYPNSDPAQIGGAPQIEVLRQHSDASIVLLSVGGNDARFGEIGHECALRLQDCTKRADEWLENLWDVEVRLTDVYSLVRETVPEAKLFVTTYPNPFRDSYCDDIPTISRKEYSFLSQEFLPRLNEAIRSAAAATSVSVLDLERVFDGRRICEVEPGDAAVNIVGLSRRSPTDFDFGRAFHNSFHPNALGHTLFARRAGSVLGPHLFSQEGT